MQELRFKAIGPIWGKDLGPGAEEGTRKVELHDDSIVEIPLANVLETWFVDYDPGEEHTEWINAIYTGDEETAIKIAQSGIDIHANLDEAFIEACYRNMLKLVEVLISKGAEVTIDNNIALVTAVEDGNFELIEKLINAGADETVLYDQAHIDELNKQCDNLTKR